MYPLSKFWLIEIFVVQLGRGSLNPLVSGVGTKHLGPVRINQHSMPCRTV